MRRHAFTIIEVLVVSAIIGVLVAVLLPALQAVREASARATCANNLKQLGVAAWAYEAANRKFPAGATQPTQTPPLPTPANATWAVLILPYIEQEARYDDFPANVDVSSAILSLADARTGDIPILLCPSDGSSGFMVDSQNGKNFTRTNYVANLGKNGFAYEKLNSKIKAANECGMFANSTYVRQDQIRDGTSQTVMFAEILRGESATVPASAPRTNFTIINLVSNLWGTTTQALDPNHSSHKTPIAGCESRPAAKFTLGANNGLRFHYGAINYNTFYTHTVLPNDARRDCILGTMLFQSHLAARSRHTGGVNTVFTDGSVRFIANTVTLPVWQAMGTRAGADTVDYQF